MNLFLIFYVCNMICSFVVRVQFRNINDKNTQVKPSEGQIPQFMEGVTYRSLCGTPTWVETLLITNLLSVHLLKHSGYICQGIFLDFEFCSSCLFIYIFQLTSKNIIVLSSSLMCMPTSLERTVRKISKILETF